MAARRVGPFPGRSTCLSSCSTECEQFLVKTADFSRAVYEMDFENPVALSAVGVEAAHPVRIVRVNVECNFILRNPFVRKLADEMASDLSAEFPAVFHG